MPAAAFFDLDSTLLDVNSGTLWLRAEWRAGRIDWYRAAWATWWLLTYTLGADTMEPAIESTAKFYAGIPEREMEDRVRAWFESEVQHRVRPGALRALAEHRAAGDVCVLATSSSQFIARLAVERYGLDAFLCTEIQVREGQLTGGLDALGFGRAKTAQVAQWANTHGVNLSECAAYTDSYSDISLLEAVGRPVVVDPDRRLRRAATGRGWPIADWGISD